MSKVWYSLWRAEKEPRLSKRLWQPSAVLAERGRQRNYIFQWSNCMSGSLSFSVILEPQEDGGFTALVPALPEVVTEGDTEEEALANAREAIEAILEYRRDNGIPIPDAPYRSSP
jgi:antitoxin HicB